MKYTGIKAYAQVLVRACECGEIVSSDDMAKIFADDDGTPLPYSSVRKLKSESRKVALKRAVYWSYDPLMRGYRVCPTGDRETADRMSAFDVRGANGALGAARLGWLMRRAAKLTSNAELDLRTGQIAAIMTDIETLAEEIES